MQESETYLDNDGKCESNDKGCNDLVLKIIRKREPFIPEFTEEGYYDSWEGEQNIDPEDWQAMLSEIRDDVHSTWGMFLPVEALWYDTPFYNVHGTLSGRGCLGVKCYDRSELNYAAQGELWAAVGVSNETGHAIVKIWKESKCLWVCERNDLREEYEIFDVGYQHYQELYPP